MKDESGHRGSSCLFTNAELTVGGLGVITSFHANARDRKAGRYAARQAIQIRGGNNDGKDRVHNRYHT